MCLKGAEMRSALVVVLTTTCLAGYGDTAYGGHDLFTSLDQLKELWKNELKVVDHMKELINKMDNSQEQTANATLRLKEYVNSHHLNKLDQEPNLEYLGHPLDAYHFVRHVASNWERLRSEPLFMNTTLRSSSHFKEDIETLMAREQEMLPARRDVEGGAFGIVRLWCLYKFNETEFINSGIISTTLANGHVVRTRPSILKINSYDLAVIANEGQENHLYDAATTFMNAAAIKAAEEESLGTNMLEFFGYAMNSKRLANLTVQLKKVHDHKLDKKGEAGVYFRTHPQPFDPKMRKKKKFKNKKEFVPEISVYSREKVRLHDTVWLERDEKMKNKFNEAGAWQGDELCRGKQLRTPAEMSNLTCYYAHNGSPWLRLGPMKVEINSYDPFHMTIRNLMFEHECDRITEFLGPTLNFPPGRMDRKRVKNDWTMKNCWPRESDNIYLEKMNRRIEHLTALNANAFKNFSEPFMCGNYGIGGHYFIHPDYHHHSPQHYSPGSIGNRVATVMTVFQSPEAGGATVWPYARISVFPEKGSAAYWRNSFTDDTNDVFTRHKACPVLYGQKWIGNKWVGYNAQWDKQNCKTQPTMPFDPVLR